MRGLFWRLCLIYACIDAVLGWFLCQHVLLRRWSARAAVLVTFENFLYNTCPMIRRECQKVLSAQKACATRQYPRGGVCRAVYLRVVCLGQWLDKYFASVFVVVRIATKLFIDCCVVPFRLPICLQVVSNFAQLLSSKMCTECGGEHACNLCVMFQKNICMYPV